VDLVSYAAGPPDSWQPMIDRALALDHAGVDRLLVSDHVAFGEELDDYARPELGGVTGGRQPTGPDGHWLEPLTTLAYVAALTGRIRLCTRVVIAALRRPIVLAKVAATLDVLSGGRLDLGVGVGWQRAEYDASGLDFTRRGRLLDESLEVCQLVWRETSAGYHGPGLSFDRIHAMPKPRQRPLAVAARHGGKPRCRSHDGAGSRAGRRGRDGPAAARPAAGALRRGAGPARPDSVGVPDRRWAGGRTVRSGLSGRQAGQCTGRVIKPICWPLSVRTAPSSTA
jgi:alkanesulfonate monooxygenase SsuD/methylene tetrahydromethanopterin reductase-like flavin-dependent oxidoreductase (luciferase family)